MALTTVHVHLSHDSHDHVLDLAVDLDPAAAMVAIAEALGSPGRTSSVGGLSIDRPAREALLDGRIVPLTRREFDLLAFLADHPRQVFSRQELLTEVWSSSEEWQVPSTVTEHVRRIRQKLAPDSVGPEFIENVRGVGYRFVG